MFNNIVEKNIRACHHVFRLFLLCSILILFQPGQVSAQAWGKVMVAPAKTNIRAGRTINEKIRGQLQAGQQVRADFLKDDWYAVFDPKEKQRSESRALGYVYAPRLSPSVPAVAEADKIKNTAETTGKEKQPLPAETKPLTVKGISVNVEPSGHERVLIAFSHYAKPAISSVEGNNPRIVMEVENVFSLRKELIRIRPPGKLVRLIRSSLNRTSHRLRIVVELEGQRHYEVEPVFYKAENSYLLDISEVKARQDAGQ